MRVATALICEHAEMVGRGAAFNATNIATMGYLSVDTIPATVQPFIVAVFKMDSDEERIASHVVECTVHDRRGRTIVGLAPGAVTPMGIEGHPGSYAITLMFQPTIPIENTGLHSIRIIVDGKERHRLRLYVVGPDAP